MTRTQEVDFGTLLIERRIATAAQVKECFAIQTKLPQPAHLGAIMVKQGYLSEQQVRQLLEMVQQRAQNSRHRHAAPSTSSMVRPIAAPPANGSGVMPMPGGGSGVANSQENIDLKLGQLVIQRRVLGREHVQQAFAQLKQYRGAGHSISLAQILAKNYRVPESNLRQLLQDPFVNGGRAQANDTMASGPFQALSPTSQSSCASCGARIAAPVNRCPACGSPVIATPPAVHNHAGSGFHNPAMAPHQVPPGYQQVPLGPPPSGPMAVMNPQRPAPMVPPRPLSPPTPAMGSAAVPIFGVDSGADSNQLQLAAPQSTPFELAGGPPPSGLNRSGKGIHSGSHAPLETCISPDDPIALKMPTVQKPDGSYEIVFGPYDILGEVARGGMGIVYRARQRDLKRVVALKVMKEGENASEKQIRRFRRETEAAAKLQHPNIVAVHEVGCIEAFHFFTMDLIEGDPLDVRIKRGECPDLKEALNIVKEISQAIHYAHGKKIVHRDLKPANILMDLDGHPKVTDFGLAKNVDHKSMLTRTGAVVGTPYYMPPEQARGDTDIDARCDVYALGVILYELMTGKLPFRGETTMEVYHKILEEDAVPPRQHNSRIPRDAEVICLKAMEKERHRRYQTSKDLAEDLQRFLEGEPIKARPLGIFGKLYRKAKKNQAAVVMGAAALIVLSLCSGFFVNQYFEGQQHDDYVKSRHEWDNYTSELENQLITAQSSISAASAKIKDKNSQNALQDLEEARRTLGRLPLLINNHTEHNSRARAGLYLICLDSKFRNYLFDGEKAKKSPETKAFMDKFKAYIEESEVLTSEKAGEDDPFGEMDDTVYLPCTEEDIQNYLKFVTSSSVDLGAGGKDLEGYRVESALPSKDLCAYFRDIFRERGHAFQLRDDELGYKKALAAYRKALDYDGQSKVALEIRLEIGKVLAASGKLKESLEAFKKIISASPGFTSAYLERGHIYDRLGHYKEAVKDYSQVIDKDFEPIDAYLARGRTFMKVGLFSRALQDFEEVIEHKDDSFWGYLERGRAHMALGNTIEAEGDLTEAIDLNASLPEGYASLAELRFVQGKFTEATKNYDVALVRGPQYFPASLGLGQVNEWKLDYEEAKRCYEEILEEEGKLAMPYKARTNAALGRLIAIEADPRNLKEQNKGSSAFKQALAKQQNKALEHLDEAINLDPDLIAAYITRGRLHLAKNNTQDAAKDFEFGLRLMNKRDKLAEGFDDAGDDLSDGEGTIESEPARRRRNRSVAEGLLGLAMIQSGNKDAAINHLRRSEEAMKKSPLTSIGNGLLNKNAKKNFAQSITQLKREKGEMGSFFTEGCKAQQQAKESRKPEHFIRARRAFARVLFLNPWHSLAWYERGRLESYWEKNLDGAVEDATEALKHNPELRKAFEFRGFLYARDLPTNENKRPEAKHIRNQKLSVNDFTAAIKLGGEKTEIAHAFFGRALSRFQSLKGGTNSELIQQTLQDLEKAISNAPKEAQKAQELRNKITYHELRSQVYKLIGEPEKALADKKQVEKLLAHAKKKAVDFKVQAVNHQKDRHFTEAIAAFNRAIEFDPELSDAFYLRGLCYLKIGNFIPGILDFSRALELDPSYADQFYNKVYQVNYVVDLKRVMDELHKIVEERPNVSYVIFLRGFFFVAKSEFKEYEPSDLDKGIRDFDHCLKLNPTHVTAKTYRGLLYYKKKDYKTAHENFFGALDIDNGSGISYYLQALCYATQSGESQGATSVDFKEKAMECLRLAFKNSFRGYDRIRKDKGFEQLKGYPPFEKLMKNKK
jgi:serine/threonine protein kinase/Tfp pilus assembly protein PilF